MLVELRPIGDIRPYQNNPRLNDDAVDAVAASIREFGFRQPIVVDTEGVIIVGHTRYKAALKLGLEKVPVHVAKDLSAEQIKAYRIADNKTAELAEWNYELLPIEIGELQACNFDLGLLGFDRDELAQLLDPGVTEGLTDPDDIPEPPDEAITKPGDLWILGEHRLLCGDSSNPEHVDRLLAGAAIHLVNTDPPYNVKVEPRSEQRDRGGEQFVYQLPPPATGSGSTSGEIEAHAVARCGPRTGHWPMTFMSDEEFDQACLHAWFGNYGTRAWSPVAPPISGAGTPTAPTTRLCSRQSELYFSQAIIWVKEPIPYSLGRTSWATMNGASLPIRRFSLPPARRPLELCGMATASSASLGTIR